MNEEYKQICQECGGHIAYDNQYVGRTIQCPHCGKAIVLGAANQTGVPITQTGDGGRSEEARAAARPKATRQTIVALAVLLLLATVVGVGLHITANRKAEGPRKEAEEVARSRIEAERLKAEAERAKGETEKAKAEAEMARLKAEEEARAKALAKAAADAEASASVAAAKAKTEQYARLEEERKARVKGNPAAWALWEEQDHETIQILSARPYDASLKHRGTFVTAKYEDLPGWLRVAAGTQFRKDGEARGLIREIDGKIYDLRLSPGGWISIPTAEVIQIVDDGYLLIDVRSLEDTYALTKVFKVKHNGLSRILNRGDRIQVAAMSVGTYTYESKGNGVQTVPVYDPGMPVGPLREKVVTMGGRTASAVKRVARSSDEPIGNGSGFFISDDGLFISNAHVVEDSTKIEVRTAAGKKLATVLRVDKDRDLALLRVSVVKGTVATLHISTNKVTLGTQIFTIGYPLVELQGSRPKFTDGRVSSLAGLRDDPDQMQISVPVQPGNSGGPLTDMNGDIVGVIVARLNDLAVMEAAGSVPQNVNYAVKGTTLVQFLKENKDLAPQLSLGSVPRRTPEEAIQVVEKASGLVLIY